MSHHCAIEVVDLTKEEDAPVGLKKRSLAIVEDDEDDYDVQLHKKKHQVNKRTKLCEGSKPIKATNTMKTLATAKGDLVWTSTANKKKDKQPDRILGKSIIQKTTECKLGSIHKSVSCGQQVPSIITRPGEAQMPSIPKKSALVESLRGGEKKGACEKNTFNSPTCSVWLNPKKLCRESLIKPKEVKLGSVVGDFQNKKDTMPKLDATSVAELLDVLKEDIQTALLMQESVKPSFVERAQKASLPLQAQVTTNHQQGKLDEIHSLMNMLMSGPPMPSVVEGKKGKKPQKSISSEELLQQLMKKK